MRSWSWWWCQHVSLFPMVQMSHLSMSHDVTLSNHDMTQQTFCLAHMNPFMDSVTRQMWHATLTLTSHSVGSVTYQVLYDLMLIVPYFVDESHPHLYEEQHVQGLSTTQQTILPMLNRDHYQTPTARERIRLSVWCWCMSCFHHTIPYLLYVFG